MAFNSSVSLGRTSLFKVDLTECCSCNQNHELDQRKRLEEVTKIFLFDLQCYVLYLV